MRKLSLLAASFLFVPAIAAAQGDQDWSKVEVKATHVAGQVYVIEDASAEFSGGNIGVSIGADGIVMVDDKFAALAPKVEAALKSISDQPVRFVLNTHYHGDHIDGNSVFGQTSVIVAHENTRAFLVADKEEPTPPTALPVVTFEDKIMIHLNGEGVRAIHFPHGHTDTDIVVFFTTSNVVHMGDDFFNGMFPFVDASGGGSIKGLIANIEKLLAIIPADAKIIPGHGAIATTADLRAYLGMLKATTGIVEAGIAAGKSARKLKREKALAAYDAWAEGYIDADGFIDQLYKELSRKP